MNLQPSNGIYRPTASNADTALRQGELLSNLKQYCLDLATLSSDVPAVYPVTHPYAVVLTQDCDLDQDFKQPEKRLLPSVLFVEVLTAAELRSAPNMNVKLWQRIQQNKDDRYHFLQSVARPYDVCDEGLPELASDFKRYFTLPKDEVYRRIQIGEARRRCMLISPYLEHLSSRFANFLSRIALPEDHFSEPATQ